MVPIESIDHGFHAFFMGLPSESYEAVGAVPCALNPQSYLPWILLKG